MEGAAQYQVAPQVGQARPEGARGAAGGPGGELAECDGYPGQEQQQGDHLQPEPGEELLAALSAGVRQQPAQRAAFRASITKPNE